MRFFLTSLLLCGILTVPAQAKTAVGRTNSYYRHPTGHHHHVYVYKYKSRGKKYTYVYVQHHYKKPVRKTTKATKNYWNK